MVIHHHTLNTTQKQPCHLLDLPKELRVHIYSFFLITLAPICITDRHHRRYQTKRDNLQIQILRLCTQIHAEAADILYGSNTFECLAEINRATKDDLREWLTQIGPANVALLNHILFTMVQPSRQPIVVCHSISMIVVETHAHLRGPHARATYTAKYEDSTEPWTAELQPDPNVEAQLELLKTMEGKCRFPLTAYHFMCFYDVAMQVRPKLKDAGLLAGDLPEGTKRVLGKWWM